PQREMQEVAISLAQRSVIPTVWRGGKVRKVVHYPETMLFASKKKYTGRNAGKIGLMNSADAKSLVHLGGRFS
ncbi:hypothetical protein, partial [Leptospira interrogans]|uniref:hypothetical protein n=1 Tax=Leptospira interrogans TaxID=173 RepID=UPI001D139BFF